MEYGPAKTLHEIAKRIDFVKTVNRIVPKRNGISVGELTLLMTVNRCLGPRANFRIPDWYERTYLTDSVQMDIEMALASRVMEMYRSRDAIERAFRIPRRPCASGLSGTARRSTSKHAFSSASWRTCRFLRWSC